MGQQIRVFVELPIGSLLPDPKQPRQFSFDEPVDEGESSLQNLAQSIREHGILSPIRVSEKAEGRYQIESGERRWRAAQLAGLETVPVEIVKNSGLPLIRQLVENLQRQDLRGTEYALTIKRLRDDHGLTQAEIAKFIGKSEPSITRILSVLDPEWAPYMEAINGSGSVLNYLRSLSPRTQGLLLRRFNASQITYSSQDLMRIRQVEKAAAKRGIQDFVSANNLADILSGKITNADLPDRGDRDPDHCSAPLIIAKHADPGVGAPLLSGSSYTKINPPHSSSAAELAASVPPVPRDLLIKGLSLLPPEPEKSSYPLTIDIEIKLSAAEASRVLLYLGILEIPDSPTALRDLLVRALKNL